LSGLSFGVYLVHVMVLYELRDLLGAPDGWSAVGSALGYAAAAALLSLALVAVVRRIPGPRALPRTETAGHAGARPERTAAGRAAPRPRPASAPHAPAAQHCPAGLGVVALPGPDRRSGTEPRDRWAAHRPCPPAEGRAVLRPH